jgi:Ca-activated chloride channel family protein
MKRILIIVIMAVCLMPGVILASSAKEAAGTEARSSYLSAKGMIVPPDEIYIDHYIASVNYQYPIPTSSILDVYMYSGHQQISKYGQEEVIQIGIQGEKKDFQDLTPMNLAFVIDRSGSMASADKLDWVKDAFDIFIQQVRDVDYVSLVIFDSTARVMFPATRMDSIDARMRFKNIVHSIQPGGSTNIRDGLMLGCLEVVKNLNREYTNRVLFLSDGQDTCGNSHREILDVAQQFCNEGVTISTIGVGESFDLELMVDMAHLGGGSSRFISDREEMEETFGSELDRMVVPLARNLDMTLEFLVDVDILDTWGYENRRIGNSIRYFHPTLHHGDYETILVNIKVYPQRFTGTMDIARFTINYEDIYGNLHQSGPHILRADIVDIQHPVTGFTDGKILKSGTMLHFAQNLKTIGELYYYRKTTENLERALEIALNTKKELLNTRIRLDSTGFIDEIGIIDQYIEVLGRELYMTDQKLGELFNNGEIAPLAPARPLQNNLSYLCREIALDLKTRHRGVIAVCDFASQGKSTDELPVLITDMAVDEISKIDAVTLVEPEELNWALQLEGISPSNLTDKLNAIEVGKRLKADYIMTGTVIETTNTFIIFSRLLNVKSGEVASSAQVIVNKV